MHTLPTDKHMHSNVRKSLKLRTMAKDLQYKIIFTEGLVFIHIIGNGNKRDS